MSTRNIASSILRVAVTAAGLAFALTQIDLRAALSIITEARLESILAVLLLMNASLVVRAWRWWILLRGLGARIGIGRLILLYFSGNFFNMFLPSGIGGDVVRALEAGRDVPKPLAAGSVFIDRLAGLLTLFAIALIALPWRPADFPARQAVITGVIASGGLVTGLLLLDGRLLRWFSRWLPEKWGLMGDSVLSRFMLAVQTCDRRALAGAGAVSIGFNLMLISWWALAGAALGYRVSLGHYALNVPLLSLALLAPSIGGLGVREVVAQSLFLSAGLTVTEATTLSLLEFSLWRLSGLLGAPLYILAQLRPRDGKTDA